MAFFTVIIPLFNKENFIENTLKSVLNQSFIDFEVLIINDGSTDKSEEKVLGFKDARIHYFYKKNSGVSAARNFGIEKAKSNYITFIDADDYWYPHFLQEMFENVNRFTDLKVFSAAIEVETSKKIIPSTYSIVKTADCEIVNYFEASSKETVICTSCAVFHKSVFETTGYFDINLKSGEDTDMWIRIGLIYHILFSWKILARYVYDPKSITKNHTTTINSFEFSKYTLLEKTNPSLKKFLDLNRFSLAIKSKIIGKKKHFLLFYKAIDLENLSLKKRILLKLPVYILKPLIDLKTLLANFGLGNSVFK
ncbi:glycosyltransferase family 2 protein [Flavobacterium franklandianum]|uniref:glycosyltransferase family 2 protein n=1 Tax=Flavobacterium franklandianum TaxID=2594430 RepID=UPI001179E2F2|nr:glycosyltransferase family 2 protein [Flavobacterium franklandianum]TRX24610.1 glycosyltransferase family 2 protein [Flavobacterium franklandianum]